MLFLSFVRDITNYILTYIFMNLHLKKSGCGATPDPTLGLTVDSDHLKGAEPFDLLWSAVCRSASQHSDPREANLLVINVGLESGVTQT